MIAVPFLTDPEQLRSFVTVPRVYKDVALHLPADFAINRFRSRLFGDVGAAGQVVSKKPTSAAVKLIFAVVFSIFGQSSTFTRRRRVQVYWPCPATDATRISSVELGLSTVVPRRSAPVLSHRDKSCWRSRP